MTVRNSLSALIGLWFIMAPWLFHYSDHHNAFLSSVICGAVQLVASLLAIGKKGWYTWQNWVALLMGVWFIMFPIAYGFKLLETTVLVFLAVTTVLLNYFNMNAEA
ncbi:SPW repeat protein [Paenibacillus rigui]|uniref:SPW repeat-containing integral membrane domain-containing protein n=1 Tax=Paenibacillus rigui TaxID=554312 RepID=A0A229UM21_9BACL|nr:SPW repeat protein [Paenibacillus rigui]OXM84422.1 hypothetical protein CF651_20620 [Paenibacillus rigui]